MQLAAHQVARLETFLERIANDTYPEEPSDLHDSITESVMERALGLLALPAKSRVLDVGCGQGVALKRFVARGHQPVGVTLNAIDVAACVAQGFDVRQMDQSFLEFEDEAFDLVWCRHCLEHSIFPYYTLDGFHRVLAPGGTLYVEVPAPDTTSCHQANSNHYSVLGKSMMGSLLTRSGFSVLDTIDISFVTPAGPDMYWGFAARRR